MLSETLKVCEWSIFLYVVFTCQNHPPPPPKYCPKNDEIFTKKNRVVMTIISVQSLLEKCHYLTFLRGITFSRPLYHFFWPFYNLAAGGTGNLTNNAHILSGRLKEAETNLCLLRGLQAEDVAGELEELREVSLQNTTSLSQGHRQASLSQGHPQASWRNLLHRTTLLPMALLGRQCRLTHSCPFLLPSSSCHQWTVARDFLPPDFLCRFKGSWTKDACIQFIF